MEQINRVQTHVDKGDRVRTNWNDSLLAYILTWNIVIKVYHSKTHTLKRIVESVKVVTNSRFSVPYNVPPDVQSVSESETSLLMLDCPPSPSASRPRDEVYLRSGD